MRVIAVQKNNSQPSFGILKGHKKTPYGDYMWGVFRNKKFEVYDAYKYQQKLIYVADNDTWRWLASKFTYLSNGIKRVVRSHSHF